MATVPDGRTAAVHWLTVTVHTGAAFIGSDGVEVPAVTVDDVRQVVELVTAAPRDAWVEQGHGGRCFRRVDRLAGRHVTLYHEPLSVSTGLPAWCSVDITGEGCELLGVAGVAQLLAELDGRRWQWAASRIDLAVDGVPFTPQDFWAAVDAGDVRTWANLANPDTLRLMIGGTREHRTTTCYLGSVKSERQMRVYDRRGYTRLELQLRGDHARAVTASLMFVDFDDAVIGAVRAYVDLVDRAADENVSRCPLLPWWAAWCDGICKFAPRIERPTPTLESAVAWVERSLAPMLSAVLRARGRLDGERWLRRLLEEDGPARWGPVHRAILSEGERWRRVA